MGKVNKVRAAIKQKLAKRMHETRKELTSVASKISFKAKPKADDQKLLLAPTLSATPKKHMSKKEKFHLKHKNLLNKFALLKKQRKEEFARKIREKTAVVGDMRVLKDALPSLDELFKLSRENIKTGITEEAESSKKLNARQKILKRKKQFLNRVNSLRALLKDADFKKNPREAIAYHIKYTNGLIE